MMCPPTVDMASLKDMTDLLIQSISHPIPPGGCPEGG